MGFDCSSTQLHTSAICMKDMEHQNLYDLKRRFMGVDASSRTTCSGGNLSFHADQLELVEDVDDRFEMSETSTASHDAWCLELQRLSFPILVFDPVDAGWRVKLCGDAFAQRFGYTVEEVVGSTLHALLIDDASPVQKECTFDEFSAHAREGRYYGTGELTVRRNIMSKSGEASSLLVHFTQVELDDDMLILTFFHDLPSPDEARQNVSPSAQVRLSSDLEDKIVTAFEVLAKEFFFSGPFARQLL